VVSGIRISAGVCEGVAVGWAPVALEGGPAAQPNLQAWTNVAWLIVSSDNGVAGPIRKALLVKSMLISVKLYGQKCRRRPQATRRDVVASADALLPTAVAIGSVVV